MIDCGTGHPFELWSQVLLLVRRVLYLLRFVTLVLNGSHSVEYPHPPLQVQGIKPMQIIKNIPSRADSIHSAMATSRRGDEYYRSLYAKEPDFQRLALQDADFKAMWDHKRGTSA